MTYALTATPMIAKVTKMGRRCFAVIEAALGALSQIHRGGIDGILWSICLSLGLPSIFVQ
jgi:hypothetical protein